ncbi:hypothetical protein ACQ4PT_001738 [Festuca glaucescens]
MSGVPWKRLELAVLCAYALVFYLFVIRKSLHLSQEYSGRLYGLRAGSLAGRLNDLSDAQWRNFRGNLPVLTAVMGAFLIVANALRYLYSLKSRGASLVWLILSLTYLCYLHGACVGFILAIAGINYSIVKLFARFKYCTGLIWSFNLAMLILNRVYEGYSFSLFGQKLAFLDNYRGTFRWHICFNFVVLRMISFGCDYCWTLRSSHFDHKKHMQKCEVCYSGKTCYLALQEKGLSVDKYTFLTYLCYLTYAPLYIAGPVVSYNAFAAQLDVPQKNYSVGQICIYGLRWILNFLLMEAMTHFFHYNAFVVSRLWRQLTPFEIFIISYGVRLYTLQLIFISIHLGKLISWAWLTCLFFVPEILIKSLSNNFQAKSALGRFIHRELGAIGGAVTISCLMVANLVGYVVGPSGIKVLMSQMLQKDALPALATIFATFYVGVKVIICYLTNV